MSRAAGWFAMVIGSAMLGVWAMLFIAGDVPELETRPVELAFHLIAETATALVFLIAGAGLLSRRRWGLSVYLLAIGMLLYTLLNSSGYYAQAGDTAFMAMFAVMVSSPSCSEAGQSAKQFSHQPGHAVISSCHRRTPAVDGLLVRHREIVERGEGRNCCDE